MTKIAKTEHVGLPIGPNYQLIEQRQMLWSGRVYETWKGIYSITHEIDRSTNHFSYIKFPIYCNVITKKTCEYHISLLEYGK